MNYLKSAATAAQAAAKMAAESAKKTYADLKAYPSQVRCSGCPEEVEVPASVFDWSCPAGHVNRRAEELCEQCKVAQPKDLPEPTVTCVSCQSVTTVPTSNAKKLARESATKTKEFAVATAAATKSSVEHLRSAPTTFHCAHCDTLLAVPTGPWACQTCCNNNEEAAKNCGQCGQKKSDQKAICGVCRQSTVIPSTNLANSFKHTVAEISSSGRKVYYDVANKPYLTCPKCAAHVAVEKKNVQPASPHAASPHAAAEGASPAPEGSPASSAPGGAGVQEGTYQGESVMCPKCKNPITQ